MRFASLFSLGSDGALHIFDFLSFSRLVLSIALADKPDDVRPLPARLASLPVCLSLSGSLLAAVPQTVDPHQSESGSVHL